MAVQMELKIVDLLVGESKSIESVFNFFLKNFQFLD
jgi:hypothetical protein